MPEMEIQLDQKDIQRIRRINLSLQSARDAWDANMKLILVDYIEDAEVEDKHVGLVSMDFKTGKMKINIGGDKNASIRNQPDGGIVS